MVSLNLGGGKGSSIILKKRRGKGGKVWKKAGPRAVLHPERK